MQNYFRMLSFVVLVEPISINLVNSVNIDFQEPINTVISVENNILFEF